MKKGIISIFLLSMAFILGACNSGTKEPSNSLKLTLNGDKKIELYLPKLSDTYDSVYDHWKELELDKITLMNKPLLGYEDIEYMDNQILKVKKNFIIVNGRGLENSLIYDDKKPGVLNFEYSGKEYNIKSESNELFYNYTIYDICVVNKDDNIFIVKQVDFKREEVIGDNLVLGRQYKKGIIGIPYVLVVDGVKTELGVLKVDDAEFAVPEAKDSWCYMGLPEGMIGRFPRGKILKTED
jgi:hypothetical protein